MKKAIVALVAVLLIAIVAVFALESRNNSASEPAPQDAPPETVSETTEEVTYASVEDDEEFVSDQDIILEDDPTTKNYENGIVFDEEVEDSEVQTTSAGPKDFIGSWTATSGQAAYYYGNIDLTVESNGTWKGNITEEPLRGKWVERDGGLYLTCELISFTLKKSSEGHVIMQEVYEDEEEDDDGVIVVLSRD